MGYTMWIYNINGIYSPNIHRQSNSMIFGAENHGGLMHQLMGWMCGASPKNMLFKSLQYEQPKNDRTIEQSFFEISKHTSWPSFSRILHVDAFLIWFFGWRKVSSATRLWPRQESSGWSRPDGAGPRHWDDRVIGMTHPTWKSRHRNGMKWSFKWERKMDEWPFRANHLFLTWPWNVFGFEWFFMAMFDFQNNEPGVAAARFLCFANEVSTQESANVAWEKSQRLWIEIGMNGVSEEVNIFSEKPSTCWC